MHASVRPAMQQKELMQLIIAALATGGVGYRDDHFVEYDMDSDDEKWLGTINAGDQVGSHLL